MELKVVSAPSRRKRQLVGAIRGSPRLRQRISVLAKCIHRLAGGVSGPPIRGIALAAVRRPREMMERPIIGGGRITTVEDVRAFAKAGAQAFSIGTLFLRRPWAPNRLIRRCRELGLHEMNNADTLLASTRVDGG